MITFFKIAAHLPLPAARALGLLLGWSLWLFSPGYRRLFRKQWGLAERRMPQARLWRAIGEAGLLVAELPKIWCDARSVERVQVEGMEACQTLLKEGRGLILLTPHLGAFELAPPVITRFEPMTILYRPSRQPAVERLYQAFRPSDQIQLAQADAGGVRRLLRTLKAGGVIGLLPDQVPGRGEGLWAPFLGRPAYTMTLPMRLAQATGAPMAWVLCLREPGGWRLVLRPWNLEPGALATQSLDALVAEMNRTCEALVAEAPEQYLWAYNRFKQPKGALPPPQGPA